MDELGAKLFQRFDEIKRLRESFWDPKWQEIADHMLGRRDFLRSDDDPGRRRDINLYDTTGRNMVNLLAGGLHSLLTNPATEWFDLKLEGDGHRKEIHEVNSWLEQVQKILLSIFQNPESRFTSQSDELYLDLVSFGTGGMFVSDTAGSPIMFSARPLMELYVAEDISGRIDTVFRRFKMTSRQAVSIWGKDAPEDAKKNVEGMRGEAKVPVLHAVFPTDDPMPVPLTKYPMPWCSVFVSESDKKVMGRKSGYHEMPYLIARWRVDGGEVYGRGPGDDALADQKMTSSMKQTALQAGQMAVAPPILTEDDSSIIQLDLRPFGRNIVKPGGAMNPPIQPLNISATSQIGIELIRDTRRQVEEAFHFEILKLIQNPGKTPMTATQTAAIQGSVERLLTPILGRLQSEFLGPLIDRVFGIAVRRGLVPPAPPDVQGATLKVEYVSPITRSQKQGDIDATVSLLTSAAQFAQFDPDIIDLIDTEEAIRFVARQSGVPAKIMRSRLAVQKMREAQRALAEQQQQKQNMLEGVDAAGKLAPVLQAIKGGTGG